MNENLFYGRDWARQITTGLVADGATATITSPLGQRMRVLYTKTLFASNGATDPYTLTIPDRAHDRWTTPSTM